MVYLFLGKEDFLKRQELEILKTTVCGSDFSGLNYDEFQAAEDDINKIIDCAKTVPFMAKSRMVVAAGVDKLKSEEKELLISFIENHPAAVTLILLADSLSASDSVYKAVSKRGKIKYFDFLAADKLNQWIIRAFAEFDKKAEPDAIKTLVENVGTSLMQLRQATQMIATFVGESGFVRAQDVENLTGKNLDLTTYQLVDAIISKDAGLALQILNGLDKDIKTVSGAMGLIGWHLRRIWRARKLLNQHIPPANIASAIGVRHDKINSFFKQMNSFTIQELENYFKALLKIDKDIKSTAINPYRALEIFVVRLCAKA